MGLTSINVKNSQDVTKDQVVFTSNFAFEAGGAVYLESPSSTQVQSFDMLKFRTDRDSAQACTFLHSWPAYFCGSLNSCCLLHVLSTVWVRISIIPLNCKIARLVARNTNYTCPRSIPSSTILHNGYICFWLAGKHGGGERLWTQVVREIICFLQRLRLMSSFRRYLI